MTSPPATVEDRTVYPVEEPVGEDLLQTLILEVLRPLLARWLKQRGERALVGADQFIYYKQFDPHQRVAPDIYVLPGVAPDAHVRSWKTWESGIVPSFALEVVSSNWEKDYCEAPTNYDRLGVRELIVFDPGYKTRPQGVRWARYAREAAGHLTLAERTDALSIDSAVLGCTLRAVGEGTQLRLRIAEARDSLVLFPTAVEAERAAKETERAAKDAERAAKDAERAARDAERAAKEAAWARIEELEAELAKRE